MQKYIEIYGANQHNLKNINVKIPRDKFTVITGLSGSGKSSLAFDTIYAEGQRRYVESLSSYARMFLGQIKKPEVERIEGLSPAVSIDQKTTSKNPRSTVGTTTEIYDYLRLLFARAGIAHCPKCGREISAQTTDSIVEKILKLKESDKNTKATIMSPVVIGKKGEYTKLFEGLLKQGFSRVRIDNKIIKLTGQEIRLNKQIKHFIDVVVDRIQIKQESRSRIAQAVELSSKLSSGIVTVKILNDNETLENNKKNNEVKFSSGATRIKDKNEHTFSLAFSCPEHGYSISKLEPRDFSFNAPYGACSDCLGLGFSENLNLETVIPDSDLSLEQGCIEPFKNGNYYPQIIVAVAKHLKIKSYTPWKKISQKNKDKILNGCGDEIIDVNYRNLSGRTSKWAIKWDGVEAAIKEKIANSKSQSLKSKLSRYFVQSKCKSCNGMRLKPEFLSVTVANKNIYEVCQMSAGKCYEFFKEVSDKNSTIYAKFSTAETKIITPIVKEILTRLKFLNDVGLDYLTLERTTASLSGGEAQRIRLATQIGTGLMGVLYILDEPSIGLHQKDNIRLINALKGLRDLGNTVVVVEHDEETIRMSDYIVDIGPYAGHQGGRVVSYGSPKQIQRSKKSITADYLNGKRKIEIPKKRRFNKNNKFISLKGVTQHNLKNINLKVPLSCLCVVSGVSGSGKSSLIIDTLSPVLTNALNRSNLVCGKHKAITGLKHLDKAIVIDQNPIGRTPRSNPATYIGLWDDIRALFASTQDSKIKGYSPGRFSFNMPGGRCEACKGDGQNKIEMHFLPDVYVTCEQCGGKRYNRETLEVKYKGKSIADILDLTVDEAFSFFSSIPPIARKLKTLHDVGLGYIHLGQPATTLSGGEAQRVKLSSELQRVQSGRTFYILDEPTTGLHFEDVKQLLAVLNRLVDAGNTVLVIEHNLDVIKSADYIIDLGPEGGEAGGYIIDSGTPEELSKNYKKTGSYTGEFLSKML